MSLTRLLKAPIKLFKKDVISFLIIRRHDLGVLNEKLRYIAVKPGASMGVLRQKIWHLLDLPDYCEEVLVLKNNSGTEITLMELRKGSDPQHPFLLEVWLPDNKTNQSNTLQNNMLTIGDKNNSTMSSKICICEENTNSTGNCIADYDRFKVNTKMDTTTKPKYCTESNVTNNMDWADKKSDLSRMSSSSIFQRLHMKKSDNFINILLKIQSDLNTLSTKLSNLENRIPM